MSEGDTPDIIYEPAWDWYAIDPLTDEFALLTVREEGRSVRQFPLKIIHLNTNEDGCEESFA